MHQFVIRHCYLLLAAFAGTTFLVQPCSASDAALAALVDKAWQFELDEDPLLATEVGHTDSNDKLPAVSLSDSDRRNARRQKFLARLEAIDAAALTPAARTNFEILRRRLQDDIAEHRFRSHLQPITQRSGFHVSFPELRREVPLVTTADFENYLARLRGFNDYAAGYMELMRAGVAEGIVLPAIVLEGFEPSLEAHIVDDPEQSLFYEPFGKLPVGVPQDDHDRLRDEARSAIADVVVPTYGRFLEFMQNEYVPQARGSVGASALAGGREFYRHRVRRFTTLDTTPEEMHQLGLAEVQRIRAEMDDIIRRVEFDGDFAAFVAHLRDGEQFYAQTTDELLKQVAFILKKMDGKLPELFSRLPRTPYGLRPVPDYIAPRTTTAYYMSPSGDGTRAGFFYMNTFDLKARPLYILEALSLHEAVPGHHLQIALQQELPDLHEFRQYSGFTAFVEGWALYAERLGREVGFYEDPYSDFGRLTMEIWRACRLVVDTGIHYFGWTRQQAIDYLHENSALSLHNIRAEVDRYISWPGQALAYKAGELKIRELRAKAEAQLGSNFDIRAFHDAVLAGGAVPLDVLERQIDEWIAGQTANGNAAE